jgi:outer membrane lipoprotein-sorting protein
LQIAIFLKKPLLLNYNFLTKTKEIIIMDGTILVTYKILCNADLDVEVSLKELLENEQVLKSIKSVYAKGLRNVEVSSYPEALIKLETQRNTYTFEVSKDDYADLLSLAEEDAKNKKLLKKDCERVELVDIETL